MARTSGGLDERMNDNPKSRDLGKPGKGSNDIAGLLEVADEGTKPHLLVRGFVLGVVVAAAMAVFIVQNTASIGFEWLWFDFDARLWLVLLAAFGAGLLAGPLLLAGWRRAARREERRRRVVDRFKRRPRVTAPERPQPEA
jgi:uncharacterized integral membrane protein